MVWIKLFQLWCKWHVSNNLLNTTQKSGKGITRFGSFNIFSLDVVNSEIMDTPELNIPLRETFGKRNILKEEYLDRGIFGKTNIWEEIPNRKSGGKVKKPIRS